MVQVSFNDGWGVRSWVSIFAALGRGRSPAVAVTLLHDAVTVIGDRPGTTARLARPHPTRRRSHRPRLGDPRAARRRRNADHLR